jgi:hypothetical protein
MPQVFRLPARLEPAVVPAAPAADGRYAQDQHQHEELEEGERPLPAEVERQIGDAANDRERGEQEVGDHAPAIRIREVGGDPIGPGEAAQDLSLDPVREGPVGLRQCARARKQRRAGTLPDRLRRLVALDERTESAGPCLGAEQDLDPTVGMEPPMAARPPGLTVARARATALQGEKPGHQGAEVRLGGAADEPGDLRQRLGPLQHAPAIRSAHIDPHDRRAGFEGCVDSVPDASTPRRRAVPDRDEQVGLFDHDPARKGRTFRRGGAPVGELCEGRVRPMGREKQGGETVVLFGEGEDPGLRRRGADLRRPRSSRTAGGATRQDGLGLGQGRRFCVHRRIEVRPERQRSHHLPAAGLRAFGRQQVGARRKQAVQPRPRGAGRRIQGGQSALQGRPNRRLMPGIGGVGGPMACQRDSQPERRRSAVAGRRRPVLH